MASTWGVCARSEAFRARDEIRLVPIRLHRRRLLHRSARHDRRVRRSARRPPLSPRDRHRRRAAPRRRCADARSRRTHSALPRGRDRRRVPILVQRDTACGGAPAARDDAAVSRSIESARGKRRRLDADHVPQVLDGMVHAFCVVAALVLAPFTATFIQLNDDNAAWSAERWQASVVDADRLGIREVIVQWSMLDSVRFDRAVDAIVAAARDHGLRVTIGVAFDAQFWSALDRSDADLARHLDKVREASLELAREVNARLGTDAPLAGWYLPQEIDDVHWTSPARRQLLLDFVRQIAEGLVAVRRGDVTLSGFANGQSAPNVYAAVWRDLARQGVTRVLFQDGVGAGKLAPESAAEYVAALTREVAG